MTSQKDEYTAVLMDTIENNEVTISSEKLHYTVMWLGTKSGFIIKTLFLTAIGEKIVLEKRKVFDPKVCDSEKSEVTSLLINKESGNGFVTFSDCVIAIPLCPHIGVDCERECKEKKDPYCTWDGRLCQGTTVHDISRDQDLDGSERLVECPGGVVGDIPEDRNKTDPKPTTNPANELVVAGNENSMAILTAFIGCFIGIVLTSFIFLCCNPCHQLMKKRERHFSERSGLTRSNSKRHNSNLSVGGNPNSLQRGNPLQRNKIPSESSSKSYVISTRLSNNENVVMLDATQQQGRKNSDPSGDKNSTPMVENVFKVPGTKEAEILKARKISTSSKSGMLINQVARTPMINESMVKFPRQQTLPHPITSPMTPHHHQLQRSHSNQYQMVAMPIGFHQKAPNTLQQIGRQQSFHQRPSLLSNQVDGLRFHPNPAA